MFLESVVRAYHAYLSTYTLTLGEILNADANPGAVRYDKYAMKYYTSSEEHTVGLIPKYLSKLCFKFVLDGGDIDAEVIGKKFNAGNRMRVEVPVELRFSGNKKCLEKFRDKIETALIKEEESNSNNYKVLKMKYPTKVELGSE